MILMIINLRKIFKNQELSKIRILFLKNQMIFKRYLKICQHLCKINIEKHAILKSKVIILAKEENLKM